MAVYTEVSSEEIEKFIAHYNVGKVVSLKGIAEGVENSNYLLKTTEDNFILTLYERRVNPDDLPFFLGLMDHLAEKGVNCATPIRDKNDEILKELCGRPAALIGFLQGLSIARPTAENCYELGAALAEMHMAVADFKLSRENSLSLQGWKDLYKDCNRDDKTRDGFGSDFYSLLDHEMTYLEENFPNDLPKGIIHADLFPDNVFFLDGKLSGLIDYYFACSDMLSYDLAICMNAWCFENDFSFNITKSRALIKGYQSVRALTNEELENLPVLCRGAAMRFLLTRLYDWQNRVEGALVKTKDPSEYIAKLKFHQTVDKTSLYGI